MQGGAARPCKIDEIVAQATRSAGEGRRLAATGERGDALEALSRLVLQRTPTRMHGETGGTLTVATYNIGDFHRGGRDIPRAERPDPPIEPVSKTIRGIGAQVVLLQEVPSRSYLESLRELCGVGFSHYWELSTERGPGLGFLSGLPLAPIAFNPACSLAMGASAVQVSASGHAIAFCNVHLPPVEKTRDDDGFVHLSVCRAGRILYREVFADTDRSVAARALIDELLAIPLETTVVGGDFNTVFPSRAVRSMRKEFRDTMDMRWGFWRSSYKKSRLILPSRVDYLFYRGNVEVLDSSIFDETPGDHFPVVATFAPSR